MNLEIFRKYIELHGKVEELKAMVSEAVDQRDQLGSLLAETMSAEGIDHAATADGTVYLRRERYCNRVAGVTAEQVCKWLEEHGHGDMVVEDYHPSRLKALVLEYIEQAGTVPRGLDELVKVTEVSKVSVRKG